MNEPLSSLELLPEEEGGANLTYLDRKSVV